VVTGCIWLRVGTSGRLLWTQLMNLWVPLKAGSFLTRWVNICFSRTLHHGII
jgi:hypothetical protein